MLAVKARDHSEVAFRGKLFVPSCSLCENRTYSWNDFAKEFARLVPRNARIIPAVPVNNNHNVNTAQPGMPRNPKRSVTKSTNFPFHPASRNVHTAP